MSRIAIRTEKIGKRYRIGRQHRFKYMTLRDTLTQALSSPLRKFVSCFNKDLSKEGEDNPTIWALRDISFEVAQGEVLGVIGHNGAGKSTLLKILSRITEPTEGRAEIHGRFGSLLEVGTGFHPELTGRENLFLSGAILGMKKAEILRKFDEILAFAEIEKFIDTPVKHYSMGMYMRLAFAVAAHLEPEILMIDEVLAVGDASFQKKCLGKMKNVAGEGRTILFVSHNMEAIIGLCSRAIWINKGRLQAEGPAASVVRDYLATVMSGKGSVVKLTDRTDRIGNGRLRFTGFHIRDKAGNPIESVMVGDAADFVLSYILPEGPVPNVTVWMWVRDSSDRIIMILWSRLTGHDFVNLSSEGELICHVSRFPLMPGTYSFDLCAVVNMTDADQIRNAVNVEVIAGDFFGTGVAPRLTDGMFLCDQSWAVREKQPKE